MTIELNPVGTACYASCEYCYLEAQREGGNLSGGPYDMEAMKRGLMDEIGEWDPEGRAPFTLHGGDPLGMPIDDLEEVLRWGFEKWGATAIQTIGARMTEAHIDLWERYNTRVGISIDGPGEMNDLRKMRGSRDVRDATEQTMWAIEAMRDRGISVSVIIVLHKLNMDPEKRGEFFGWLDWLDEIGVSGIRFHPMELDYQAEKWAPPVEDYGAFYRELHEHMKGLRLEIDIVADIRKLLRGDDRNVTCTFNGCDPYTTPAVRGVDGQGERTNCGRTNKDGVAHPKADRAGQERQLALYRTPQEDGGCKGCRWWFACKGQCPGEGLGERGDWRNRSGYCELYKELFRMVEQEMLDEGLVPLSLQSKRTEIEELMDAHYQRGQRVSIHSALEKHERGWTVEAGGSMHGDAPHGDSHGDHTDG